MGPIRNPRWEQKRTKGYVIVSKIYTVINIIKIKELAILPDVD
jgi:hypothetical protein